MKYNKIEGLSSNVSKVILAVFVGRPITSLKLRVNNKREHIAFIIYFIRDGLTIT